MHRNKMNHNYSTICQKIVILHSISYRNIAGHLIGHLRMLSKMMHYMINNTNHNEWAYNRNEF